VCDVCNKHFTGSRILGRHVKTLHTENDEVLKRTEVSEGDESETAVKENTDDKKTDIVCQKI
jgi:hypothetical protein